MIWTALTALAVAAGVLASYTARFQATTLWAGKKLAGEELSAQMPRGFQDAITPTIQDMRNMVSLVLYVAILVLGCIQAWYVAIGAIIAALLVRAIADRFMPDTVAYYLLRVAWALDNREADYRRDNDVMRADAAHHMADLVKGLFEETRTAGQKVPSMREAGRVWQSS